jgi:acyl-CoA synthetase (AMP-forming)/AMP-acid ligase II
MALLVGEIFRRNAANFPERIAASMENEQLSYAELNDAGNAMARVLAERGIGHGDRVVCWADTSLEVLPLFVGLAKLGAIFAPLNARLVPDEAGDIIAWAKPKLLVADAERAEAAQALAMAQGIPFGAIGTAAATSGTDLTRAASTCSRDEVQCAGLTESDPHVIFFTSGSTGRPKGVLLSHRVNCLRGFQGVFVDEPERSVCMFPLFHMAAFTLAIAAWQTVGEIVLVGTPTAEALLGAVARRSANRLYCIPAIWGRILEADFDRFELSSLRTVDTGTSATPPELLDSLRRQFPDATLRVYYGSTEGGAGTALASRDVAHKPGSVGRPVPGVELRVTEEGEVCLRSDYLMDGYFEDEPATTAALRDGWYHTGDLGNLDEEGFLWITGRLRDVIRAGGESVSPSEVEAVLVQHPAVAEVAVVGIPDPEWGELICAVLVLNPAAEAGGEKLDLESLRGYCKGRLARFKHPRRMEIAPSLPRTAATGQIQRPLLVERILAAGSGSQGSEDAE